MPIFSDGELSVLRSHAEYLLIDTCTIQRPTLVNDGGGGRTKEWRDVYTNVRCRTGPVRNEFTQEGMVSEALGTRQPWIVSLPYGTDIRALDRIVHPNGSVMDVSAILAEPRSISTVIRAICFETK